MAWSKYNNQNFKLEKEKRQRQAEQEAAKVQQAENKQNTFYGDYKSRQNNTAQTPQGNTLQRAVSENPFTPIKTTVYKSYDDRKKSGNVFIPSTVLGKHTNSFNSNNVFMPKTMNYQHKNIMIDGFSEDLNINLNSILNQYKELEKTKHGVEFNKSVQKLMSDNSDILAEYTKQKGGGQFTFPGLVYDFEAQKQKNWQNKLDTGYQRRLDSYYDVVNNEDFKQYTSKAVPDIKTVLYNKQESSFDKLPKSKLNRVERAIKNMEFVPYNNHSEENGLPTYYSYTPYNRYEDESGVITETPQKVNSPKSVITKNFDDVKLLYMTDEERQIYAYHFNKYGENSAEKFLKTIKNVLDKRYIEAYEATIKAASKKNKIKGVINDIGNSFGGGISWIDSGLQALQQANSIPNEYIPYNPYSDATIPVHAQRAAREGITQDMSGFAKAATNLSLSIGENVARLPLGMAGLPIMGASVAGQTAVNKGLNGETSAGKAFKTGTAYGAIEIATEKIPLDNVLNVLKAPPSSVKESIITLLKNMGIEATEEAISNVADNIADKVINGDNSEYEQYKRQLQIDKGYDEARATIEAFAKYYIQDTGVSALEGGLSGGFINSGSMAIGSAINTYNDTINTGRAFKDMGEAQSVIDTGIESDRGTSAYKYADKMQQKHAVGKDLSDWNVGRQYQKNFKAIQSENEFAAAMSNIKLTEITDRLYSDNGRELNGAAASEGIKVSSNGSQSIPTTIKHEWSHMFRNLDPTAYSEYEASVIKAARETNSEAVDKRMKHLMEEYGYSREVAQEEIVAELTGGFDTMAIQRMAEGNATLANKMALAAGKAKSRIKAAFGGGKYTNPAGVQLTFEQLNNAEKQYIKGLDMARSNVPQSDAVRNSPIEYDNEGKAYVNIKENQGLFTGVDKAEYSRIALDFMNEKYKNQTMPLSEYNLVKADKTGIRKFVHSGKGTDSNTYQAKMKASGELHNLLEAAEYVGSSDDGKNHQFAKYGFDYYKTRFVVDGQMFEGIIDIGVSESGSSFYGMTNVKRTSYSSQPSDLLPNVTAEFNVESSFNNSISKNGDNVKYSVKENTANHIASDIIKENGSAIKKNEIADDVKTLYELLTNGEVTDEKYRTAWGIAENIGQRVAQGIQIADSEMYDNYKDLRDTLRNTPVSISDADRADITDADSFNEFRRKNFGSLRITNDGTRIDQLYQELSELYPNFFDAEKETHPADQLMQIEKVLQDIKPKMQGLSDTEISEAAGDIAGKLILDIMNSPSVNMSDSQYDDWDSLMTSEEAKRQEKLQERSREKDFAEGLPQGRQGRQGVLDELSQDIRQEVELLKGDGSLISKYNAESASRIDKKEFTKSDIIPAIKNYGVGFMTREVDKLYPIKAYERHAQNQVHGKEKIQFRGKESPYVMSSNSIDAESRAKYILTEKLTDFDANEIGESLADIVGELDYDDYRDFNTYLKLKHGLEWIDFKNNDYKPVFQNKILNSYEAMMAGVNELKAKHSDFEGLAQRVYDYQGKLMQAWLVDTGIITQEQFDILREKYPCYVPFFRQDDTPTSHFRPKKGIANQSNPIMQAEGGGQKIYDPIENIMINTSRFVNAAAKNSAMQAVVNIYDTIPGMEYYMTEVVKDERGKYVPKDKNHPNSIDTDTDASTEQYISDTVHHTIKLTDGDIVSVLQDGKKRYFKVSDKHFLDALDNMRPIQSGAVMRAVASATRVFSALATSNNPVFTLASNPIKDTQNAFMQTTQKNPFAVVTAILDAQVEQFKNSDIGKRIGQKSNADYDGTDAYKKYMAMGGEYASAFSAGRSAMKEALKDVKPSKDGVKTKAANAVKFVPRLYGNVADAIETGPRLGEFKYSNGKAGNDVHQAHFDSKNVTLNFGRSGTVGEKINKFVPFYNPSVQGISMMVQNFKNKPFQTSMRVGVGIALSVLLSAFNKRDDESEEAYENASAYLKNNYYLFHIKDGKFFKIPKSQEYGLAPSLVERVIEKYAYDNPDAFYNYADYLSTALLPSLLQAEFPFVDTGSVIGLGTYTSLLENKDFKGSPIVPDYLQDEVPEMQYDERTSYIARWIGKALKWSPKKIDYVIKSNTGFLGKINESIGHSGEKDWSMGVSTKFTADSLFSTDKTNMFYENRDEADKQAKSYSSADNEYLSKRFSQSGKMMSILNAMYKENRNDSKGREIRKAYIDYATENKDNPSGYSEEVYNKIKNLFDTDSKVLSLPSVDRIIKAKIGKEDKSYTFNDAESILHYQSDLNKNVDEAYRKLLSDISFNAMPDIDKVSALSKAKETATDEVKRFYIENEGGRVMFDAEERTEITVPSDSAMGEYNAKKERHSKTQNKIQSVVDKLAQSTPDKAEYYSMPKLTEFDIRSVKIGGKSYDITGDTLTKVTEAATDDYYSNVDKLTNNELNIEDVIGYTKKGKAHAATDASGNKVALTGRMYNSDGTPRFDDLIMAKILEDVKEASKTNAVNKYASEISGDNQEGTKVSSNNTMRFTSKSKSSGGKRSSGGGKRASAGGNSDIHFTRAMANGSRRSQSAAALPNSVRKNTLRLSSVGVKKSGLPNKVKIIQNPLFM